MPTFAYKAKNSGSSVIEGVITADNQQSAVTKILELGQTPILVELTTSKNRVKPLMVRSNVSITALAYFSKSLADLLEAGVPLVRALELLGKQRIAPVLKNALGQIATAVRDGSSLSKSLESYPDIFNKLYVSMIRSSEAAGNLTRALVMLGQNLDKEVVIQNRIRLALMYPMIILSVGIASIIVLLTFVLPKLTVMFDDFGADLPLPTQMVVALSHFVTHDGWIVALLFAAATGYFLKYRTTPQGQQQLSAIVLRIPVISDFLKAISIARYTRTVAILLESGVPITTALESSIMVLDNAVFIEQAKHIANQVRMGTSLSVAVRSAAVFGDLTANLIAVGEQGGKLESNLFKIAAIHEEQSQHMTENTLNVLGPVVLICVVTVVGAMMFAIILPLIKMNMIIK